jgi:hypothetical protein
MREMAKLGGIHHPSIHPSIHVNVIPADACVPALPVENRRTKLSLCPDDDQMMPEGDDDQMMRQTVSLS